MFVYTCECGHKNELKDSWVCEKCGKKTRIDEKTKLFIKLFEKLSKTKQIEENND